MSRPKDRPHPTPQIAGLVAGLRTTLSVYPELAAAYLFGSTARGDARPDSDLDVGLLLRRRGDTALSHHRLVGDLAGRLESLAGGRPIDLVLLEPQGPIFCHRVLLEGLLVYEADRDRRLDFESDTLSRAFDFRPTYELATKDKLENMRSWLGTYR
ncbi:MAG: nucleotidyltransferase domain-containing protein [Planctomycetes bacterium]|nr:nucleotidyltransferase domain-containing protein [Planctomycetota bacterium]